ncbi:transcription factor DUO1-like [Prosopis cineraria]|uniref:transcription factor DUO1-like n=1 Tax=Prosopis cineraria TaxID=364024 RepID=UPI00240FC40A|nr:transcription factor DUO1-like [Prosopis cineraria]
MFPEEQDDDGEREFGGGTYIKKGPWSAEEDEILMRHVKKNGPRDWSSIRSKGLLPRTGKSCRLRWVNKLRPNLKTGCKFSAEEERAVIELQAQFGNKWAKIATYLEGRTDNDVKNFWSSRRKRLERMLQKPSPSSKPLKNNKATKKAHIHHHNLPQFEEVPSCSSNHLEENPSEKFQNLEAQEAIPLHMVPSFESSLEYYTFSQVLPTESHQVDYGLLPPVCHGLVDPEPFDAVFFDVFEQHKVPEYVCSSSSNKGESRLPCLALGGIAQSSTPASGFFEDFPSEIFDYFEDIPASLEK